MENTTKTKKPVSRRLFQIFGGIALCTLMLILIINVGVPARALSFPFVYLFGIYSYLIFAAIYVVCFAKIFKLQLFKIKSKSVIAGLIIIFICACAFTSLIWNSIANVGTTVVDYTNYFFKYNYFLSESGKVLNMFSPTQGCNYAGGLLGTAICQPLIAANTVLAYLIVSLLLITGLLFTFFPVTSKAIKNRKANQESKPEKENSKHKNNLVQQSPIITYDPIKNANKKDNFGDEINKNPAAEFVRIDQAQNLDGENIQAFTQYEGAGMFKKPHLDLNAPEEVANPLPQEQSFEEYKDEAAPLKPIGESFQEEINEETFETVEEQSFENETFEEKFEEENDIGEEEVANPVPVPTPIPMPVHTATPAAKPVIVEKPKEEEPKIIKPIKWVAPSSDLLIDGQPSSSLQVNIDLAEERTKLLNQVFQDFNVHAEVNDYIIGPSVTRYNIRYDSNAQNKNVGNLLEDIARRLGGVGARFEGVVEGSYYSGIEVSNAQSSIVSFKELFNDLPPVKEHPLAVPFGKNIEGKTIWADFNKFPHILVAGTTGSGKSVFIHSLILTLIMRNSPDNLRIGIIDPKKVEMVKYRDMPHLLCPVYDNPQGALAFLKKLVEEMNDRYTKLAEADGATSIEEYNEYAEEHGMEKLPFLVIIVDEYGDLVESNKEISQPILLLGQKARACGIHMLISTQSPTTNIITGPIKNNLPTHVALLTANSIQSQTILGCGGAEKLVGHGDMLVQSGLISKVGLTRLQGCFAQKKEISYVVGFLKEHYPVQYNEKFLNLEEAAEQAGKAFVAGGGAENAIDEAEMEKYQSVKEWVMSNQYMSMSRIQGSCAVGFNRARRFFEKLQAEGIIAKESDGNKGCPVLVHDEYDDSVPTSDELTSF